MYYYGYSILIITLCLNDMNCEYPCTDANGTTVSNGQHFYENPCSYCECILIEDIFNVACTEVQYECPCESRCCDLYCNPRRDSKPAVSQSGTSLTWIFLAGFSFIVVILLIVFVIVKRRARYRRLARELADITKPNAPPPKYEDIETDGGCHSGTITLPPKYEDIVTYTATPPARQPPS